MRFLRILVLTGVTTLLCAQDMNRMATYYLVLLRKGPAWGTGTKEESERIGEGHMANIRRLAKEGKLILAGPLADNGDIRGIFIFGTASLEETRALCDTDPAVKAGRLAAEIHPWLSAKGIKAPPEN
jgi:uncharacterized protein YciI